MQSTHHDPHDTNFLVIDSDPRLLRAVERYLKMNGARAVHTADTILAGRNILLDDLRNVDCILCAEDLSPMTGVEFLKDLRSGKYGQVDALRGITFIMLTSHREKELVLATKKLDVDGYILKPIDFATFSSHVRGALDHQKNLKSAPDYESIEIGAALSLPVILGAKQI